MQKVINLMQALGYDVTKKGVCAGMTQMWEQAYLADGEAGELTFLSRLKRINKEYADKKITKDNIKEKISDVRNKIIAKQPLTEDDKYLLDMQAMFDGILLYQHPGAAGAGFFIDEKVPAQFDSENISQVAASEMLEQKGGMVKIHSEPVACKNSELQNYFDALRDLIKDNADGMVITLGSGMHRIGVRYLPSDDRWLIINPGNYLDEALHRIKVDGTLSELRSTIDSNIKCNHAKIGNIVASALGLEMNSDLNITVNATRNNPNLKQMQNNFHAFRSEHLASLDAQTVNIENRGMGIVHLAVMNNHLDYLEKCISLGGDINKATDDSNLTPLQIALNQNQIAHIQLLVKNGAIINIPDENGNTPVSNAISEKNWNNVCAVLIGLDNKKNLHKQDINILKNKDIIKEISNAFIQHLESMKNPLEREKLIQMTLKKQNVIGSVIDAKTKQQIVKKFDIKTKVSRTDAPPDWRQTQQEKIGNAKKQIKKHIRDALPSVLKINKIAKQEIPKNEMTKYKAQIKVANKMLRYLNKCAKMSPDKLIKYSLRRLDNLKKKYAGQLNEFSDKIDQQIQKLNAIKTGSDSDKIACAQESFELYKSIYVNQEVAATKNVAPEKPAPSVSDKVDIAPSNANDTIPINEAKNSEGLEFEATNLDGLDENPNKTTEIQFEATNFDWLDQQDAAAEAQSAQIKSPIPDLVIPAEMPPLPEIPQKETSSQLKSTQPTEQKTTKLPDAVASKELAAKRHDHVGGSEAGIFKKLANTGSQAINAIKNSVAALKKSVARDKEEALNKSTTKQKANPNSHHSNYDYLFKYRVMGDHGSGISSLITRYTDSTFNDNGLTPIGMDMRIKDVDTNGTKVKCQIWDGLPDPESQYSRGAHGIILAIDLTNEDALKRASGWLNEISRLTGENTEIMLVGTKADAEDRKVSATALQQFAKENNLHCTECSAKSGSGVDNVFQELTNKIVNRLEIDNQNAASPRPH